MPLTRSHRRTLAVTLIELLAVVAIITILAGIVISAATGVIQRAAIARTKAELSLLAQALAEYQRYFGDYPQTGASAVNSQRVVFGLNGLSAGPGFGSAQAVLFNSLTGVYGPTGPQSGQINGPVFLDLSKFTLEVAFTAETQATFGAPVGTSPVKSARDNALLDPWGNRYLYFYRHPAPSAGRGAPPIPDQRWLAPAYVLLSAGPDGAVDMLPDMAGVFSGATQFAGDNADNIYADKLP